VAVKTLIKKIAVLGAGTMGHGGLDTRLSILQDLHRTLGE
jgi:hypothetical protein